jgi:hypothetical protein
MQEIFKDIIGYEGLYQISNFGRIYSFPKYKHKGKFLKFFKDKRGYLYVGLTKDKKYKTFTVHRLVGIHFIFNLFNFPEINHIDGNKSNNYFKNLEWVTSSQNQIHAFTNGLQVITEKHINVAKITCSINGKKNKGKIYSSRKLTPEQDVEICNKFNNGISSSKLATEYGVSKKTILNIKNNRNYRKD